MINTTAILNHLQASKVIEIRTWANVLWVKAVVKSRVICRFVSKNVGLVKEMTEAQEYISLCTEIADFDKEDLPYLSGSPKQVAWAERIRNDAMSEFRHGYKQKESDVDACLACGFISLPKLKKIWANVKTKTEAKYWIDNRHSISAYRGR